MNGPVTTVACPNGHASTNRAVCTVCGALITVDGRSAIDTTPTTGAIPIAPALPPRAPGTARHLAAAPPIDPTEARHMAPAPPAAPVQSLPPLSLPPLPPVDLGALGAMGPGSAGSAPMASDPLDGAPRLMPSAEAGYGHAGHAGDAGHDRGMAAGGQRCPHCSAELHPGARFCEVCGYDPSTGSLPHVYAPVVRPAVIPASAPPRADSGPTSSSFGTPSTPATPPPAPAPLSGRWTATITADRAYYESHQVGDVQFPLGVPPRTIELPVGPISIGRRSRSRGTNPAIDLAGPPEDPAVSHTHASLLPSDDGAWKLIDHGSTNGTYVNESLDPVPANQPLAIAPGDRVYVGAWTRIMLDLLPHQ